MNLTNEHNFTNPNAMVLYYIVHQFTKHFSSTFPLCIITLATRYEPNMRASINIGHLQA